MIKKSLILVLAIISLLVLSIPATVQAGSGLTVTASSAQVDFPTSITFNISIESNTAVTDIRLHYSVERLAFAKVTGEVFIDFAPAETVNAQWIWDMRRTGGLPPGADVTYWWTITDNSNKKTETGPALIHIEDERYDWKTIQHGQVTLKWYEGDESFGQELMVATQEALDRLAINSGAELESPVSLYIYASQDDLLGAMIFPQEWTGGVAFTEFGIIAIGIGLSQSELDWGKRTISHELTHLVVYQTTSNPYNSLPTWLDEGLAMTSEGELELSFVIALSWAEAENTYISVRSLCSPFPSDVNQTLLSYAESHEIVAYLIDEYGSDKMFELLNTFKQGSGYDEALTKVYGFDMDELNSLWRSE